MTMNKSTSFAAQKSQEMIISGIFNDYLVCCFSGIPLGDPEPPASTKGSCGCDTAADPYWAVESISISDPSAATGARNIPPATGEIQAGGTGAYTYYDETNCFRVSGVYGLNTTGGVNGAPVYYECVPTISNDIEDWCLPKYTALGRGQYWTEVIPFTYEVLLEYQTEGFITGVRILDGGKYCSVLANIKCKNPFPGELRTQDTINFDECIAPASSSKSPFDPEGRRPRNADGGFVRGAEFAFISFVQIPFNSGSAVSITGSGLLSGVGGADAFCLEVAKPYNLRLSPFDGKSVNGAAYSYSGQNTRTIIYSTATTSCRRDIPFIENMQPDYKPGDKIYVTKNVADGTKVSANAAEFFIDENRDARHWVDNCASGQAGGGGARGDSAVWL